MIIPFGGIMRVIYPPEAITNGQHVRINDMVVYFKHFVTCVRLNDVDIIQAETESQ